PASELAADSTLLVSAPRGFDVRRLHVIHPYDPGAQLLHRPHRAEDVARPYGGGEAVITVVRDPDRVGLVVERNHRRHRSKDFLARDARRVVDGVEDRRLDEQAVGQLIPGAERSSTAQRELRFPLANFLIAQDAIE